MQRHIILFISLFISFSSFSQANRDSLWGVWIDKEVPDSNRIKALNKLVWANYLYSDPDSALYLAGLQYDLAESTGNKAWIASALYLQGVVFYLKGDYTDALKYFKKSLKNYQDADNKVGIANIYTNFGNIYYDQGNYQESLDFLHKSLKIYQETDDMQGISSAYNNIGNVYVIQYNYEKALKYYQKALVIFQEIGDNVGLANSYGNIGLIYRNQSNNEEALDYIKKSLKINTEIANKRGMSDCYNNIGMIYLEQDLDEKALEYIHKSLKIKEEIGNKKGIATSYLTIGNSYYHQENYQKAFEYYNKSLNIDKEIGNQRGIAICYSNIGETYYMRGNYRQALAYGNKSLKIALNIKELMSIINVSDLLYKVYKKTGNSLKALQMHELYIEMRDSLNSIENKEAVMELKYQHQYQTQAKVDSVDNLRKQQIKDKEIEKHQLELKVKKEEQIILYVGLGLVLILLLFIFNRFRVTSRQKNVIEMQHLKLEENHSLLQYTHREITDSIVYGKKIQDAIFTSTSYIKDVLPQSFVYFNPKELVSGDFYWVFDHINYVYFTVADCTGHGVPGAFMSMIGNAFLNEMIIQREIKETNDIMDHISDQVKSSLRQIGAEGEPQDGIDMVLCRFNKKNNELMFTGAKNSLYLVRKGEIKEYKGDQRPVGYFLGKGIKFTSEKIQLQKDDIVYIYSDGFADQFGGEKGKKFKKNKFKQLLLSIADKPMDKQKQQLQDTFESWKAGFEQVDDVCVMGVRV